MGFDPQQHHHIVSLYSIYDLRLVITSILRSIKLRLSSKRTFRSKCFGIHR
jgi:hypothetical protein